MFPSKPLINVLKPSTWVTLVIDQASINITIGGSISVPPP